MEGEYKRVEIEVIGTDNPINIQLGGMDNIAFIELEDFYYTPLSQPTGSRLLDERFLGIAVQGTKGRYTKIGNQSEILKTIPLQKDGSYSFSISNPDTTKFNGTNSNINIGFVFRNNDLSTKPVVFDNNYFLNLVIYTVRPKY